jgi:hypothetical protein
MAFDFKKVKMPAPAGKDPMLSLDMGEGEESPEEEAAEEGEAGEGEETPEEEQKELEAMPDEVLVKELEKRGFRVQK